MDVIMFKTIFALALLIPALAYSTQKPILLKKGEFKRIELPSFSSDYNHGWFLATPKLINNISKKNILEIQEIGSWSYDFPDFYGRTFKRPADAPSNADKTEYWGFSAKHKGTIDVTFEYKKKAYQKDAPELPTGPALDTKTFTFQVQ